MFKDMKTLQERSVDFSKYSAPSVTIATALIILLRNPDWSAEELIAMTSALGFVINGILVVLVHLFRRFTS